jgi:hypothetical protein
MTRVGATPLEIQFNAGSILPTNHRNAHSNLHLLKNKVKL